jgi:hypothetical protein
MFSGVAVYSTKSNIAKDVQRQELWNLQSSKELLNSWKPCTDSGNITVSTMEPKFTLSTAHRPETDGQTGIANKMLKNHLNKNDKTSRRAAYSVRLVPKIWVQGGLEIGALKKPLLSMRHKFRRIDRRDGSFRDRGIWRRCWRPRQPSRYP